MKIFALILACIGLVTSSPVKSDNPSSFVKYASDKMYKFYDHMASELYNSENTSDDFESLFRKLSAVEKTAEEMVELTKDAKTYDLSTIKDEDVKNAVKRLQSSADYFILGDDYFSSVLMSKNALQELSTDKDIESFYKKDEELAYFPDINDIISKTKNPSELQYYWEQWRNKNVLWANIHFSSIIESIQKAANLTDISMLDFWYQIYENPKFINEMEKVMDQLEPFYKQLHAFVRFELNKKYGNVVVDSEGPIPDHVFRQVVAQVWKEDSVIESSFPKKDLPDVDNMLIEKKYDALKMIKTANDFYVSLGFEPLSEDFWTKRIKPEEEEEGDCHSDIFDLTPNVYVKYCKKVDFRKFLQAHGFMGHINYAIQKKDLPFYYFESYELQHPVGEAVILSASTHEHLKAIDLMPEIKNTEDAKTNRLFRMSIHTMLNIPVYYVQAKIMNDLLSGDLKMKDMNKKYWELMDKYVGVEPPSDRKEDDIDFPFKFYEYIEENHNTRKFVSEILGYQIYHALCLKADKLNIGAKLHNCDFYENKNVGKALKELMVLGSSKSWRQVLSTVLPSGTQGLDGKALLEYYAPVKQWLEQKNKQNGVKIGWNPSKKKIHGTMDSE